jgi:hypothetical protein
VLRTGLLATDIQYVIDAARLSRHLALVLVQGLRMTRALVSLPLQKEDRVRAAHVVVQ